MTNQTKCYKCNKTNKVEFYRNGERVFDFTIDGNIVTFSNGETILI